MLAGPLFMIVGLTEALTRPGFDPTRHAWSLLSNGDSGWIHMALMVVTGLLTIAGAAGMRRALPRGGAAGRGRTWGPLLVGLYGTGVFAAGLLVADPALGFPPGTPDGPPTQFTLHGILHFVAAGIGFLSLIAGCFVFARRFAAVGRRGWAAYSVATGIVFFAGFAGVASGSATPAINVAFTIAVGLAWAWVTAVSAYLRNEGIPAR